MIAKLTLLILGIFLTIASVNSQTVVFSEDFETLPLDVTSSGGTTWDRSTTLFATGAYSDTAAVPMTGSSYLTTNSFSTIGNFSVILEFDQICKIELFDGGYVEYSIDGGTNWIVITGSYYQGSGSFASNKFTANSYVTDWQAASGSAIPTNTWWKHETFDIGSLVGNQADVRIRFKLSDLNNNGPNTNYGWLLDDIKVTIALSELTPPSITQIPTIWQDTVNTTGPFPVKAKISDLSGIDTAYVVYAVNGGSNISLGMNLVNVDTFSVTIPAQVYNTRIDYYIVAVDGSVAANADTATAHWFYTKQAPPIVIIGTGTTGSSTLPTNGFYDWGWTASLYTANEIGNAGYIDSIFYYVSSTTASYTMLNQRIMMQVVPDTFFASGAMPDSASLVTFYTGNVAWTGPGWYKFVPTTPFYYNGNGSLLIHWRNRDGDYVTGYPSYRYTSTSPVYQAKYVQSDTYTNVFPVSSGTLTYNRPNIKMAFAISTTVHDVAVNTITSPTGALSTGTPYDVKVKIKNFGSDTLTSASINWSVDGVIQTPYAWNGSLLQDEISAEITIGSMNISAVGTHNIEIWTSNPDGFADEQTLNDSLSTQYFFCPGAFAGTYTVGPVGDFTSIGEAITALNTCGINGAVVFNIANGTYNEQLTLNQVSGASATNTITFQSASGNANDVIVTAGGTGTSNNFVWRLNGTDYFRLNNISLQATGVASGFTTVLSYSGAAKNNIFNSNRFIGIEDAASTSVNNSVIYSLSGATSLDSNNVFVNNYIQHGSYGVYAYGSSSTALEAGSVFRKNQIINPSYRGMAVAYQDAVVLDSNVIVSHPTSSTSYYAIYAYYCDNAIRIIKNTMTNHNSGYGLYLSYCDAIVGSEGLIGNNMISVAGIAASYGIYDYYTNNQNFYFNSVNVSSNNATARAAYISGSTTTTINNHFVNNILAYTGVNTAGMAVYVATTQMVGTMNYNDLYSTGTNIGYWTANRLNLTAWQGASGKDANSVSINPSFFSATDLHTATPLLYGIGTPLASVPTDIDGDVRSLTAPCIGADEFIMFNKNIGLVSILAPVSGCALSASEAITIRVTNSGLDPITTFDAYYVINGGTPVMETKVVTIAPLGTYDYTFTTPANLSAYGMYNLDVYVTQPGEQMTLNDTINGYEFESGWDFATPYTMGFEPTENYSDWSIFNGDGHATYKWVIPYSSSTYSHTGSYSAQFYNNAINTGEDWLFSRCFPLEAGKTYEISFWYRAYSTSTPQTFTLAYGTAASPAAMTNVLETITGFTNATHIQSINRLVAPATGSYNFGWSGLTGLASYGYIDDINISLIPEQEAEALSISSPSSGCGLSNSEAVTLQIKNTGASTISGNLTANYKANNGSVFSENVPQTILSGDTLDFIFAATIDMSVTTQDSLFDIVAWISLTGDPIQGNDTTSTSVTSGHVPLDPTVFNDTIPYGTSATLIALSPDSVIWYVDNSTLTSFFNGETYNTPLLTDTITYWVEATTGIADIKITEFQAYEYTSGGSTNPKPAWLIGDDQIEITNLGSASIDLSGYTISIYGVGARTYTIPSVSLIPGEIAVFHVGPGTDNPAVNFYNMGGTTNAISSSSLTGIVLKNPSNVVIDAVAVNSYSFDAMASGVASTDWSGNIASSSSRGGVIRNISDNNSASDWVPSNSPSPIQTFGAVNPTLSAGSGSGIGCASNRIPITAVVLPPAAEFEMAEMVAPINGCTNGSEDVIIKFRNSGADTLDIPFDVSYQVNSTTPITETLNYVMLPGDSITHTFATPILLPLTTGDTTFNLAVWGNLAIDFYNINDSLESLVTLGFTPPAPIGANDTVPYGTSATVAATSIYDLNWYDQAVGGNVLDTGLSYTTPQLYANTTYWVGASEGTQEYVGPYDYSIGTSSAYANTTYRLVFDVLNPSGVNIAAVDIFPSVAAGAAYSIVVENASSVVIASYSGITTVASGQRETAPVNFTIPGGTGYKIGFSVSPGMYRNTTGATFPYTIPNELSITGNTFSGYPQYYYFIYNWLVSSGSGCESDRTPVQAVVTGQPNTDAGIISVLNPVGPIPLGIENIEVELQNFGLDALTSVDIAWSVNGTLQTPFAWTGSLATGEKDTVIISTYDFVYTPYPGMNNLVAWTENPNATTDAFPINDTTSVMIDAHDPFNGTYYIQTAFPDFANFADAVAALNDWGVDGPVTVLADNGTYDGQLMLTEVPGVTDINTLTFGSVSGINTDVVLQYAATGTADNYVVKLAGSDYITFENMTIRSTTASTYGRVVELSDTANFNRFDNNIIESIVTTSTSSATVYCYTTGAEIGNVFENNQILNGYYGVYFYGSSTKKKSGNKFIDNTISGWNTYGLYAYYNDSISILGNTLENSATSGTNYHIYSGYNDNGSRIENNIINGTGTGTFYGMYLYYNNSTATIPNKVANNFISQTGSAFGTAYGIYVYYSNYQNIYFNSVNIGSGSTTAGRALYQTGGASNVNIANNNLANTSGGYAYYVATPGVINVTNFNNLFTNGATLAYWGSDRTDLAQLQAISGKDLNSKSVNPLFYTASDLHTSQFGLYGSGTPIAGIATDIDGDVRDVVAPTIGADEYIPSATDAGIIKFDEPPYIATPGLNDFSVTLANFGTADLISADIAWTLDGTPQTTFAWTGTITFGNEIDSIAIGSVSLLPGVHHAKAWSEAPNAGIDMNNYNDTATYEFVVCDGGLKGTYSIGATGDFGTFNDAVLYANTCGIDSIVVFEVETGLYAETVTIPNFPGSSSTNTVTFISQSGIASDVVLQPATVQTDFSIVRFNNAQYITWQNMTLDATAFTNAVGFKIDNSSNGITIDGNIIEMPDVTTGTLNVTGIYDATSLDTNLVVTNNVINNGSYGIYISGNGTTSLQPGAIISGNTVNSTAYYGIRAYYLDSPIISSNNLTVDGSVYSSCYGMYIGYCDNNLQIIGNSLYMESTGSDYGLYLYYNDALTTGHSVVANNFVSMNGTGSTTTYAVYFSTNTYMDFVFNSINSYDTYATSRALYVTGGSNNISKNNIIAATGGGFAAYFSTTTSFIESDYNDLYSSGAVLGYHGANIADLAAWQTASSKDANSLSVDPLFVGNNDLHVYLSTLNAVATPIAGITTDIDGDLRDVTPDIGADEFTPQPIDLGITALLKPTFSFGLTTAADTVKVRVFNFGSTTATSFSLTYTLNGTIVATQPWTGNLIQGTSTDVEFTTHFSPLAGPNNLEVYVTITGDGDHSNDTVNTTYKGIPTLNLPTTDDFETVDYWGANSTTDGWELGAPAGILINSAYSPVNSWVTNLDGAYAMNQTIYLYTPVYSFLGVFDAELSFYHWYDADASDGGFIEYSNNGGLTWDNLGTQNDPNGTNWAPSNISTGYGWSGTSAGWVQSSINLSTFNNSPFGVQFRFVFYSDFAGTNGEGWAIDNFEIFVPTPAVDAGVVEIVSPTGTLSPGVAAPITVKITNFGTDTLYSIPVVAKANTGQPPVNATWTGTLHPGDTATYTFPSNYTPLNVTTFEFCAYTDLASDFTVLNDTSCVTLLTDVGIDENGISEISLNPNPANYYTMLEFEAGSAGIVVLQITTADGKLVRESEISIASGANSIRIETADLAAGMYFWKMRRSNSVNEGKLIITR